MSVANEQMPYLLCLQDPANPQNDLGRGVWRILDIKRTLQELSANMKGWLHDFGPIARKKFTPLEFLLGTTLDIVRDRRDAFRLWAFSANGRTQIKKMHNLAMRVMAEQEKADASKSVEPDEVHSSDVSEAGIGESHDEYDEDMNMEDRKHLEDLLVDDVSNNVASEAPQLLEKAIGQSIESALSNSARTSVPS